MVRQLLNIMHHAVQLPLSVYLGFTAQRKAMQSFITAQVAPQGDSDFLRAKARERSYAKHRFHLLLRFGRIEPGMRFLSPQPDDKT